MPVTTEDTPVTAQQALRTSLYKCLVISLSPGQPKERNPSHIQHLCHLCSSRAGRCCIMSCCTTWWAPALRGGHTFTHITQQTGTTGFALWPTACQGDDVWQGHSNVWQNIAHFHLWQRQRCFQQGAGARWSRTGRAPGLGRRGRLQELWAWEAQVLHSCGSKSKPAPEKCSPSTPQPLSPHSKTGFSSVLFPVLLG